ncbi:hypothetical protein CC86DRAFT_400052 [Ophiobolus disseminans]|uniref:Uncharacterized protein n=1 Tax=Ophiobolus disseminans TaxID=1469910 RepID=A0A6A7AL83_9PLEO|nr:hypothetical protein CC86DRAFT_400052 [Ophiobolus disseminans]
MASKLCCTAEQEARSDSPELPNARISVATPAQLPLLSKQAASPSSHFTSTRSEDLHELRQIFEDAQDHATPRTSPSKAPRARNKRTSIISLHSLHKMTSMHSIIRKKFSKELPNKDSKVSLQQHKGKEATSAEPDTVVKHSIEQSKHQLKVTKDDLRKDLLSDKKPDEGGYDSDAEVLDDVARNIGKKTPSKRPSIHSVDWAPSSGSKSTPGSSNPRRDSTELKRDVQPYQIQQPQTFSLSSRFAQVFSTPNLRIEDPSERDRALRRSHSATSIGLPTPLPLSPMRLPSLGTSDQDGVPWSEVMSESLRLSKFPSPPLPASLKVSKTPSAVNNPKVESSHRNHNAGQLHVEKDPESAGTNASSAARTVEIRVQQPTSIASPRPSTSVRGGFRENAPPAKDPAIADIEDEDDENNPRRSVHLHSMRISHHLRSGSLLSWDQLADAPEMPTLPRPFMKRTTSDQSRHSHIQRQLTRHERRTSSSGFASSKVPSRWGKVLPNELDVRGDVSSSIYSSRPHSPPDSFGGSMVNLSRSGTEHHNFSHSSIDLRKLRHSTSFPTDNEETPRPVQRSGVTNMTVVRDVTMNTTLLVPPVPLARKNSVADTKKSKFREEFSPSPPRKKITPSTSIMKFLNPKRLSMRSQSEANLQPDVPALKLDGPFDTLPVAAADRERRQSRSLVSLQAEQQALGKSKGANHVWDQALKAHQEEKASMFLPKNKDLAVHASPFRERSGSCSIRRPSVQEDIGPALEDSTPKRYSAPLLGPPAPLNNDRGRPLLVSRRSATAGRDELSLEQEIADAFEKQGDDIDIVGAWGRYPSHTRKERTFSAGKRDHVEARDFALEAAIRFASATDNNDEDLVDPTDRIPSPPLLPGEKKRKKKVGSGKMAKSHSMTFGRKLIKNYYSGIFKSSSSEFRRHGRGHRSSIISGGTLEHPELELLPEVFMSGGADGAGGSRQHLTDKQVVRRHSERHRDGKPNGTLPIGDSMATLRSRRNSSAPNLNDLTNLHDGADDPEHAQDRARVWSVYYETCVPSFPRMSTDADFALQQLGGPSRTSSSSHCVSVRSRTMPPRRTKHSRNASQISRRSAQPSFLSVGEDDMTGEERSLVSVRHSTMDLISQFKEQEATERERVLSMTRADSRHEGALLAGS